MAHPPKALEPLMERLPGTVLKKIFRYLSPNDLKRVKEVKKSWRKIIDEEIGVIVHVGAGSTAYWRPGIHWQDVSTITQLGISKCYFSEVDEPLPDSGFKYPKLIQELSFDGYFERTNFNKILSQVSSSLTKISLHMSTLCFLKSENLKYWYLPVLGELGFGSYGCSPDTSWPYLDDCIFDNLTVILNYNHFPRMKSLRISLLFIQKRECEMTMAIVKFLIRHTQTLRQLRMEFRYEGSTNDDVVVSQSDILLMKVALKLHRVRLDYFKMHFYYSGSPELNDVWYQLLKQQTTLGTLVYVTDRGWTPFPTPIICRNHATLVRITIKMNLGLDFFDCRQFEHCENLRQLCLMNQQQRRKRRNCKGIEGYDNEDEVYDFFPETTPCNQAPILSNAAALPKLLDTLFISWIKIHKDDVHLMHEELPKLRELSLTFIGMGGVFGMDKASLACILERRKLKRFTIIHGFNLASCDLTEDDKKDPYAFMVALCLKDNLLYFDAIQGENGFYELYKDL